jgi:glypican 4 (K-glypican)
VQVFQGCGKPTLGRRRRAIISQNSNADLFIDDGQEENQETRTKRAADPGNNDNRSGNRNSHEIKYEPMQFPRNDAIQNNHGRGSRRGGNSNRNNGRFNSNRNDNKEPELDKLIKDIKQKVKDTKKFWSNLPYTMCNNEDVSVGTINQDNCWNGHSVDR